MRIGSAIKPAEWALAFSCLATGLAAAQDFHLDTIGARVGAAPTEASGAFHQVDLFANWDLPWAWDLGKEWQLQSRLDLAGGWLADASLEGAVFSSGPSVVLSRTRFPVSFEGGSGPTVLSRYRFEDKDLGLPFQFTTYAGLDLDLGAHFRIGYRFQHMSNAGLASPNPGLNLHMFALSYRF